MPAATRVRNGVSKIEARLFYADDKTLLYLAEVLKVRVWELSRRERQNRLHEFMENDAILISDDSP